MLGFEAAVEATAAYVGSKLTTSAGLLFMDIIYRTAVGNGYDPIQYGIDKLANYAGDMMFVSTVSQGQAAQCACYKRFGCMCSYTSPTWWYGKGKWGLPMPMY